MKNDEQVPAEEKEQWLLEREAVIDAQEQHTKIERVIDQRDDTEGYPEYYIKCKCSKSWFDDLTSNQRRARTKL